VSGFRYFGNWVPDGGGVKYPTPIGLTCCMCLEVVDEGDCGTFTRLNGDLKPLHRECGMREVLGGIGHLMDHHTWCQIVGDPDAGRSYRESALEVWEWTRQHVITGTEGAS
jgi:hypothetical protein